MTVRDSINRTGARTPGAEDYPTSMAAHARAPLPTQCGITEVASTRAKCRHKPNISRCMPGAGLSRLVRGKVLLYMPAFQPYRGKPAVRKCVQKKLVCSAGDKPAGAKVRRPVVWIAGWRETKILKPIDRVSLGETTSHRAVTTVNANVASKGQIRGPSPLP